MPKTPPRRWSWHQVVRRTGDDGMQLWRAGMMGVIGLGLAGWHLWAAPPDTADSTRPAEVREKLEAVKEPGEAAEPFGTPSRHRSTGRRRRASLPRYLAGRPPVTAAPLESWWLLRPSAVGHPSRPVVTPLPNLNVVADPRISVYVPGRPTAHPMPGLSIVSPHFVVGQVRPEHRWLGAGRVRTAQRLKPLR